MSTSGDDHAAVDLSHTSISSPSSMQSEHDRSDGTIDSSMLSQLERRRVAAAEHSVEAQQQRQRQLSNKLAQTRRMMLQPANGKSPLLANRQVSDRTSQRVTSELDDYFDDDGEQKDSDASASLLTDAPQSTYGSDQPTNTSESPRASTTPHTRDKVRRKIRIRRGRHHLSDYERSVLEYQRSWWDKLRNRPLNRQHLYTTNALKSTKYSILSFLPRNLYEQLSPFIKPANFYFLVIAVLQSVPELSTTGGRPTILIPLLFVVTITAVKDAVEDYQRYKQDVKKNSTEYQIYDTDKCEWKTSLSKDIAVGDFIKMEDGMRVPADSLLISSGMEKGTHVFVDTRELDGETNFKPRSVATKLLHITREQYKHMKHIDLHLQCDPANGDLSEWSAALSNVHHNQKQSDDHHSKSKDKSDSEQLTINSMLLTDCYLRNTPWAVGLVIYTGDDTKIRQNMAAQRQHLRTKYSSVFELTKKLFIAMVLLQFILCFAGAFSAAVAQSYDSKHAWYMFAPSIDSDSPFYYGLLRFGTWFIVCKDFVPISLYVSLEVVQFYQALFISWDPSMHTKEEEDESSALVQQQQDDDHSDDERKPLASSSKSGTSRSNGNSKRKQPSSKPKGRKSDKADSSYQTASVQTSRLNEELSQVQYIFSDKTGTLTRNAMEFRKCVVKQQLFGSGTTEAGVLRRAKDKKLDITEAMEEFKQQRQKQMDSGKAYVGNHVDFNDVDAIRQCVYRSAELTKSDKQQQLSSNGGQKKPSNTKSNSKQQSKQQQADTKSDINVTDDLAMDVRRFLLLLALNNSVYPKVRRPEDLHKDTEGAGEGDDNDDGITSINEAVEVFTDKAKSIADDVTTKVSSLTSGKDKRDDKSSDSNDKQSSKKEDAEWKRLYDDPNSNLVVQMDSSSPDELALVSFAAFGGFELYDRSGGTVRLRVTDSNTGTKHFEEYEELHAIEFNSKRKRMTTMVKPTDSSSINLASDNNSSNDKQEVWVLTKGADATVKKLLGLSDERSGGNGSSAEDWVVMHKRLVEFGQEALRSLIFAAGWQTEEWYEQWHEKYEQVLSDIGEAEKGHVEGGCGNDCKLCKVETEAEEGADLELLAATAIEDKLQADVPQTLSSLIKADIRCWVLTGDNISTAINIAISCSLLDADMEEEGRLLMFDSDIESIQALNDAITRAEEVIQQSRQRARQSDDSSDTAGSTFGLALHGDVLKLLLATRDANLYRQTSANNTPSNKQQQQRKPNDDGDDRNDASQLMSRFLTIAVQCSSVIASRLEPREKAEIVQLVEQHVAKKLNKRCSTLAIGDGNNDTMMISVASIGVAVRGKEGTSAVSAADYVISEFKHLQPLLLIHGRYNNRRISNLVLYIFYKTSLVVWTLFMFGGFNQFSGQSLYLDWLQQLHNVMFTALPVLVFAVIDYDITPETLYQYPQIYTLTRGAVMFNTAQFARWMTTGLLHATICFMIPFMTMAQSPTVHKDGKQDGIASVGLTIYTCVVLVTNMKLLLVIRSWTKYQAGALVLTLTSYVVAVSIFSSHSAFTIGGLDYYKLFFTLLQIPAFWLSITLAVTACVLLDLTYSSLRLVFYPSPVDIYIEAERQGKDIAPIAEKHTALIRRAIAKEAAIMSGEGVSRSGGDKQSDAALDEQLLTRPLEYVRVVNIGDFAAVAAPTSRGVSVATDRKDIQTPDDFSLRPSAVETTFPARQTSITGTPTDAYTGFAFSYTNRVVDEDDLRPRTPRSARSPKLRQRAESK